MPASELLDFELAAGEKRAVDGNFAFVRSGSVQFQAEKSAKSWLQTATGGELLLQTFTGPGRVWLAPTQGVYPRGVRSDRPRERGNPAGRGPRQPGDEGLSALLILWVIVRSRITRWYYTL